MRARRRSRLLQDSRRLHDCVSHMEMGGQPPYLVQFDPGSFLSRTHWPGRPLPVIFSTEPVTDSYAWDRSSHKRCTSHPWHRSGHRRHRRDQLGSTGYRLGGRFADTASSMTRHSEPRRNKCRTDSLCPPIRAQAGEVPPDKLAGEPKRRGHATLAPPQERSYTTVCRGDCLRCHRHPARPNVWRPSGSAACCCALLLMIY